MAPSDTVMVIGMHMPTLIDTCVRACDSTATLIVVDQNNTQFASEPIPYKIHSNHFVDYDVELLEDKHPFDKFINPRKRCLKRKKQSITGTKVNMLASNSFALLNLKMCCRSMLRSK